MQQITLKNGETKKGFWNGKVYGAEGNQTVYFNVSSDGTKNGINWKKSEKYNRADVKEIITIQNNNPVKTVVCPKCGTYCCGDCGK